MTYITCMECGAVKHEEHIVTSPITVQTPTGHVEALETDIECQCGSSKFTRVLQQPGIVTGDGLKHLADKVLHPSPLEIQHSDPFGPISVDVHVGFTERRIVESGEHLVVDALERMSVPKNVAALITGRSTHMRDGLFMPAGWIDPGFEGPLKLEFGNTSDGAAVIDGREAAGRLVFFELAERTRGYDGRYGV